MSFIDKMQAKYSILVAGADWKEEEILSFLRNGLKLIVFCMSTDCLRFREVFDKFCEAGFAEFYENTNQQQIKLIDGKGIEDSISILEVLERGDTRFNLEQYVIEHQDIKTNLIVEAGAGTGKTHVMINRVMYLLHTDPEFEFKKVAMITFTNKATDNMRHRLIKTLNTKYELTGNIYYLDRIEELSQISISTIHSFFKKVIVEVGPMLGYGTNIQLKSYILEKRELLRDLLDRRYKGNQRVEDIVGLPIHKIEGLAIEYWEKLDNNGLSEEQVAVLQWGDTSDAKAKTIQNSLIALFKQVDNEYNEIKYINNAISIKDIIHELSRVINRPELKDYINENYKYIFCDEFQDSDNVQIQTIAILNRVYDGSLFVVGDIKQSIYRFRGASDSAFIKLRGNLNKNETDRLVTKTLNKNYRTSKDILEQLDRIFKRWGDQTLGLLQYEDGKEKTDKLVPQEIERGVYRQITIKKEERKKKLIETILTIQKQEKNKKIAVLARRNSQLRTVKTWCEKEKIVCLIKEKGSFFESAAVLDFCALIEAYLYENEPMYLFNYIMSSYGPGNVDYAKLRQCDGDKSKIFGILLSQIDQSEWEDNRKELRYRPVMSVLRRIVADKQPTFQYGIRRKIELLRNNYPEDKALEQAVIDVTQYEANLKKLLQILTNQFSGEFASLNDICDYIRIRIMTDREEEPADVEDIKGIDYVEGLTVHGAKGLEFENVLIPYMNDVFYQPFRSEILVSREHERVGWVYRERGHKDIKNDQYNSLIIDEKEEVAREETRLLYVAMTRAMYGLYCFIERNRVNAAKPNSWADLLPKELDNA